MNASVFDQELAEIVSTAFGHGSATRTDLLAAAVAARTPSQVIETILDLPERCYENIDHFRSALTGAR